MENILNYLEYLIMCGAHANEILEDNFNLFNETIIDVRGDYKGYGKNCENNPLVEDYEFYAIKTDDKTFKSGADTIFENINIIECRVFYDPNKQRNELDTMKIFHFGMFY